MGENFEQEIRSAMFHYLAEARVQSPNDGLVHVDVLKAFSFRGERIPLWNQKGIRKPRMLDGALTIMTAYRSPGSLPRYNDESGIDGFTRYKYEGTNPNLAENRSLRFLFERQLPLAYLIGVAPNWYHVECPIYIIGDSPELLECVIGWSPSDLGVDLANISPEMKAYAIRETKQRIHQRVFRQNVLAAYETRCAICQIRHRQLLDAAHIIEDSKPHGDPIVQNGIALCKIHHSAYDSNLLGIRPDNVIQINAELLQEIDGPMLLHGLQEMHGKRLDTPNSPRLRPSRERLEERYYEFLGASVV